MARWPSPNSSGERHAVSEYRFGVEIEIAAHRTAAIIADEQIDRPATGLCLQGDLAIILAQRRAEQRGDRQRFGEQPRQRRRDSHAPPARR